MISTDGETRTLSRFHPRGGYGEAPSNGDVLRGLYLDIESTSLDRATAKIVEIATVPFLFTPSGIITSVGHGSTSFNDPGIPIPPEATKIHGITDEMVADTSYNALGLTEALDNCALVVAHNADYDRRITEAAFPVASASLWGCSYRDVDWKETFGAPCLKLGHLLLELCDEFADGHRALNDCHVGVHLLGGLTDRDGRTALSHLLDSVRRPTFRVWASGAPFSMKDELKITRGYRWHDGEKGRAKAWYRDVATDEARDEEVAWLTERGVHPQLQRFTARERYSVRMDP